MSKFKVGEEVRCIRGDGSRLIEGQDYIVTRTEFNPATGNSYVEINCDTSIKFWESRFKSIEKPLKANNDRPMIDAKALISFLEFNDWTKSDLLVYLNGYIDGAKGESK
ncbi:hypothetical protein EC55P1_00032 [Enterococcus phage EC55P1]|nr:hypothetical protein EC55P1_00032 [Enterococcus phage EC55P1]